ncbi:hypothetical protein DPMN_181577 [Dreissena polymorpha]|uniref:Uncharacterized protein n=1 Tax=Dreissena polymorpha TaxID=45954 RepID=A0A9D4DE04_DREPO|nr:hypothetical protein DPMN_181577 [Dreissena polymorpha]
MCPQIADDEFCPQFQPACLHQTPLLWYEALPYNLIILSCRSEHCLQRLCTLCTSDEDKNTFYDQLDILIGGTPTVEPILFLGY